MMHMTLGQLPWQSVLMLMCKQWGFRAGSQGQACKPFVAANMDKHTPLCGCVAVSVRFTCQLQLQ